MPPMFSLSRQQISELCYFALLSDREARADLVAGVIRDEDDYTSTFTGCLRRNINAYSASGLVARSFLLPTRVERQIGCDATIIIWSRGSAKIATFEAKLPRGHWDYPQTATGLSHFSDQLARQAHHTRTLAIFEMFYCDAPFGKQQAYMQPNGSTCVWHGDAVAFDSIRPSKPQPWSDAELASMMKQGTLSIGEVLEAVCQCKQGTPFSMPADAASIAQEFSLSGHVLFVEAVGGEPSG